ncbi:FadR/GntR family transcriptional regulator [Nocardia transvalensis]|uniref:FadR/GntR family transcriptional regulator n=1 Tax=Nocardia transvalensis TaxID=37333 RepID=UPI0018960035|nr:FCD domain-containing protein [Nocardia transvalensis]MBF6332240.1 FadR family transcriptional regulator [Nocardia transvalensis]
MTEDPPALRRADRERRAGRAPTRPEQAAEELAELAALGKPGDRLGTKDELRTRCGVSVGTFNEALRMLQSRGVVHVKTGPGGGVFVLSQSPMVRLGNSILALDDDAASVTDALRLRDAIDPLLVQDALTHAKAKHIRAMRRELRGMQEAADAGDSVAFVHANWALHARIAEASPSPILRSLYLSLLDLLESHTLSVLAADEHPLPEYIHSRYLLHADLVEAIAARETSTALALIAEHNTSNPANALR